MSRNVSKVDRGQTGQSEQGLQSFLPISDQLTGMIRRKKKIPVFPLTRPTLCHPPTLIFLSVNNNNKKKITVPDHTKFPILRFFFGSLSKLSYGPETTRWFRDCSRQNHLVPDYLVRDESSHFSSGSSRTTFRVILSHFFLNRL